MSDALADLERAEEVVRELSTEVARALRDEHIPIRISRLADEVLRLLRRSLDHVAVALCGAGARFPVCADEADFRAAMRSVRPSDDALGVLRARQPFVSRTNAWIARIAELSRDPVRVKARKLANGPRVTVTREGGGEVVYNGSVRFGPGVNVCGADIDPETQLPVPTPGVTVVVERWESLVFADGGEDLVGFLTSLVARVRVLVTSQNGV